MAVSGTAGTAWAGWRLRCPCACPASGAVPARAAACRAGADGVAGLAAAGAAGVFRAGVFAVCVFGGCREGEQAGVVPAEVQHGGDPFQGPVAEPEDRDPAAGDGVIDAAAAGDRGVEAAGERHRGGVGDLVLHRGHGADPAPDQRRGGAGEQVTDPGRGAGAGIQHHQAGHRAGLAQQVDQPVRRDQVGAPVLAGQGQHALVAAGVEVPVPDEVQHVPLPVQQQVLQVRPGRARRPVQLGQALAGGPGQRAGQLVLFLVHVQGGQPAGGGDHAQDPQRRPDPQRRRHRGDRDVADQLVLPAHVRPGGLVVHRLPRQPGQRRGIDPQHHPQPLPALGGHRRGGPVPPGHLAGAQQPGEQHLRRPRGPAARSPAAPGGWAPPRPAPPAAAARAAPAAHRHPARPSPTPPPRGTPRPPPGTSRARRPARSPPR